MKPIFLFFLAFISLNVMAQNSSWKITHNNKQVLKASVEDESKNVITISASELKKSGQLCVVYTDKQKQKGWKREIALFDENDTELLRHSGETLKVNNLKLNLLANKAKTIKIYTWSLPTDPAKAAVIRIRRVHVATIRFQ